MIQLKVCDWPSSRCSLDYCHKSAEMFAEADSVLKRLKADVNSGYQKVDSRVPIGWAPAIRGDCQRDLLSDARDDP